MVALILCRTAGCPAFCAATAGVVAASLMTDTSLVAVHLMLRLPQPVSITAQIAVCDLLTPDLGIPISTICKTIVDAGQ